MVARLKLKEIDGRAPPRNGLGTMLGPEIVGTIGYVVLPTGVSTDVSRDIV